MSLDTSTGSVLRAFQNIAPPQQVPRQKIPCVPPQDEPRFAAKRACSDEPCRPCKIQATVSKIPAFRKKIQNESRNVCGGNRIKNFELIPGPFPMFNSGSDCYMNALVQCLVTLPSVIQDPLPKEEGSSWVAARKILQDKPNIQVRGEETDYGLFYVLSRLLSLELGLAGRQQDPHEALFMMIENNILNPETFSNVVSTTEICNCGARERVNIEYMLYDLGKYLSPHAENEERHCEICGLHPSTSSKLTEGAEVLVSLTPLCGQRPPENYGRRISVLGETYSLLAQILYTDCGGGLAGHYRAECYRMVGDKVNSYLFDDKVFHQTEGITSKPIATVLFYAKEKKFYQEPSCQQERAC